MRHIRVTLVAKVDRDKDVLIRAIKNSRIGIPLKRSLLKHVEIVGGSYIESKESLGEFGSDLVKLGQKIQEIAGS